MVELNDVFVAFFIDLESRGLGDEVLVVIISEFGWMARDNGLNGFDYGIVLVVLLVGLVNVGFYGEHLLFTNFDEDD